METLRGAWQQIGPIFWAVLIALLIRRMLMGSFYVPSGSMLPTLLIGDHVFVNKFVFGAPLPFSRVRLPDRRAPERGNVVIFDLGRTPDGRVCPLDRCPEDSRGEAFVKRIVGLPGDTVEMREGKLIVNGRMLPTRDLGRTFTDDRGSELAMRCEEQDGRERAILDHPERAGLPQARVTVPEGRYFVMGDNRDDSNDSRAWGTFPHSDIQGPVMIIYWSWNNRGSWLSMLNPLTWWRLLTGETRWERAGSTLDEICRESS